MIDLLVYPVHALFWSAMLLRRRAARRAPEGLRAEGETRVAPYSRVLLFGHMAALGVMYFGVGEVVFRRHGAPAFFPGHRVVGALLIASAAALLVWAFSAFRSWRFRAQIDPGHQLVTEGPFALVRHPIYLAISLLALGTLVWMPTPVVAAGALLVALGGDLRARAEEKLLLQAFGDAYRAYMGRVKRFVPGIY